MATAGMIAVAAITPGPNNFLVMRAAAGSGLRGALPAIAGVVLGGLALVGLVVIGGSFVFDAAPWLRRAIAVAGCLYLAWSAVRTVAGTLRGAGAELLDRAAVPGGVAALFAFQLLNPKSWVMVLTAVSAVDADRPASALAQLTPLFVAIPIAGLIVWSCLGSLLTRALRSRVVRAWFDRIMGLLLLASAGLLLAAL
jgi:threonine/homoserine/homoserine lactone efflux protein